MGEFETKGKMILSPEILQQMRRVVREVISVSNPSITEATQRCYEKYKYIACPHTATAISYYFDHMQR